MDTCTENESDWTSRLGGNHMLKINGYATNYNQVIIYNEKGEYLYKTENPNNVYNGLHLDINTKVRNARKLSFDKNDCFEIATSANNRYLCRSGKDLYIKMPVGVVVPLEYV